MNKSQKKSSAPKLLIFLILLMAIGTFGIPAIANNIETSRSETCSYKRTEAMSTIKASLNYGLYKSDHLDTAKFSDFSELFRVSMNCPSGGVYTFYADDAGEYHLHCTVHGYD